MNASTLPIKINVANFENNDKHDISLEINGKIKLSFSVEKGRYTPEFYNFLFSSVKYNKEKEFVINLRKRESIPFSNSYQPLSNLNNYEIIYDYYNQYVQKQIAVAKYLGWEYKKLDIPLDGSKMIRFELFSTAISDTHIARVIWCYSDGKCLKITTSDSSSDEVNHVNLIFATEYSNIDISRILTTEFDEDGNTLRMYYPDSNEKPSRLIYLDTKKIEDHDKKLYEKLLHEELENCNIVNILREKRNELFQFFNINATVVTF